MADQLFDLTDKVTLVTGGAGQIGVAICRALSDYGASVIVADVDAEAGATLVEELADASSFVDCDITDDESVNAAVDQTVDIYGQIDVLVNAAYPMDETYGTPFERLTPETWRRNLDMHLGGFYASIKAVTDVMREQQSGSIVNFGSTYGIQAPDFSVYQEADMASSPAHYSATKAGVINLTRYLASYLGDDGIRANAISPGGVFDDQDPRFVEAYEKRTPLGRMATTEDLTGAVVFLASDASSYVTGHNLVVDGGWTIK